MATSVHCSCEAARCSSAKVPTITKQPTDCWHQVVPKSSHFCTGSLFAGASSPPQPPIASIAQVTNAKILEHIKCLLIMKTCGRSVGDDENQRQRYAKATSGSTRRAPKKVNRTAVVTCRTLRRSHASTSTGMRSCTQSHAARRERELDAFAEYAL
jgi:hypothetical protein